MRLDIDLDYVKNQISQHGYFICKNDETIELARLARVEYFSGFNQTPLRTAGFEYEELQSGAIRKKNISSRNGLGEAYAQVLQTTYYPLQCKEKALSQVFELIITLRNQLTKMPLDFGNYPERDGYWNATRIHHYPCGGGFMAQHQDSYFNKILGDDKFLQILFLVSRKGQDFSSGGGYLYDLKGDRIDIEDAGGLGAVVFFDGRIVHGVADVDSDSNFSLDRPSGRLSAIANLYQYRGSRPQRQPVSQ